MSNICNMSLCRAWFRARAKTSKEVMEIFFYSSVLLKFWPHKVEKLGLINDSILDYFSVNYLIDSWGSYLSIAEMDGRNSRVQPEAYKEINWGETNLDAVWKQTATASQTSYDHLGNLAKWQKNQGQTQMPGTHSFETFHEVKIVTSYSKAVLIHLKKNTHTSSSARGQLPLALLVCNWSHLCMGMLSLNVWFVSCGSSLFVHLHLKMRTVKFSVAGQFNQDLRLPL